MLPPGGAEVAGDGQRLGVVAAGLAAIGGPGRQLAQAVEHLGLALPVAEVAEQIKGLLVAGGGCRSAAPATSSEPIAADANLDEEHVTAHVGRHTFATTLIRGGTDLVAVADMLGHARLDTVRLYTHPSAADRERALNLLPYDANQAR